MLTNQERPLYCTRGLTLAKRVLVITQEILTFAGKDHIDRVLSRLRRREVVIEELKALEKRLVRRGNNWNPYRVAPAGQEEALVELAFQEIREILERINHLDEEISALLSETRKKVNQELFKVTADHKLVNRYSLKSKDHPSYFSLSI